jgi:hypothetical protein
VEQIPDEIGNAERDHERVHLVTGTRLAATIAGSLAALAAAASLLGVDAFRDACGMVQARVRKALGK